MQYLGWFSFSTNHPYESRPIAAAFEDWGKPRFQPDRPEVKIIDFGIASKWGMPRKGSFFCFHTLPYIHLKIGSWMLHLFHFCRQWLLLFWTQKKLLDSFFVSDDTLVETSWFGAWNQLEKFTFAEGFSVVRCLIRSLDLLSIWHQKLGFWS